MGCTLIRSLKNVSEMVNVQAVFRAEGMVVGCRRQGWAYQGDVRLYERVKWV